MGPTRMSFNVSLGVGATKDCQQTDKASRVRGTQVGTTGCSHADAEEVPLSHSPASSLPRQPRCPRTRLTPCMPAESEDPRRYTPTSCGPFACVLDLGGRKNSASVSDLRKSRLAR